MHLGTGHSLIKTRWASAVCRHSAPGPRLVGTRAEHVLGRKNRVIPEAEWAEEDLSEGDTCQRPAGGDSSVLGNMPGIKTEAGMLLHVLKELEGAARLELHVPGTKPSPLSHLPVMQEQSTPQK